MPIFPTMNGSFNAIGIKDAFRVSMNSTLVIPQLFIVATNSPCRRTGVFRGKDLETQTFHPSSQREALL